VNGRNPALVVVRAATAVRVNESAGGLKSARHLGNAKIMAYIFGRRKRYRSPKSKGWV
jgi:hypothetical protein